MNLPLTDKIIKFARLVREKQLLFFPLCFKDLVNLTKMVQIKFNTVKQTYKNL